MSGSRSKRRPLGTGTAALCALLDAFALQMNLGAASGSFPLLRTPLAVGARGLSTVIRYWSTSWVGATLGLAWVIRTFRRGKQPPTP
ncbi:MAG TPA: hypothetical protein VFP05_07460 [Thermomicrobiales bacterium]|nr:hypothetical protein [Thermomicrobiales bacterium]